MAVAIFFSYCLQFYVPINIMGPWVKSHFHTEQQKHYAESMFRTVLVFFTCEGGEGWLIVISRGYNYNSPFFTVLLACIIPNLGGIISLVGAVSSSALALIFPPIIEIVTFWPDGLGKYKWMLWKDLFILMFGLLGFVFGTYTSLLHLMNPEVVPE